MSESALKKVIEKFPQYIIDSHNQCGDETLIIKREGLLDVCKFLKEEPSLSFNMLLDVTAVDYLNIKNPRFEVVYHLRSLIKFHRVRVKVPLDEKDLKIPTLTGVWKSANWFEREVFDMFGVIFEGHPDLRRLLLYDEFKGHPLRKDYPIKGYQMRISMPQLQGDELGEELKNAK